MPSLALVTGASRGIGLAVKNILECGGCEVLSPTRDELDLNDADSVGRYLEFIHEMPIDVIVNNAGINELAGIDEVTDESLDHMMRVNLYGPLKIIRGLVSGMIARKRGGRIINVSSVWSVVAKPRRLQYTIAKSGLNGLTRALAVELAPHGILVNSIAPGFVNTELTRQNNTSADIYQLCNSLPIGRLAETEEIAKVVRFLASDESSYITGQTIIIDGGFTCL